MSIEKCKKCGTWFPKGKHCECLPKLLYRDDGIEWTADLQEQATHAELCGKLEEFYRKHRKPVAD